MKTFAKIEPVILLLTCLVVFFSLVMVAVARWMSMDGQTFQVISGLVTGFSGALLMRVKPRAAAGEDPTEGAIETSSFKTIHTQSIVPPVDPNTAA